MMNQFELFRSNIECYADSMWWRRYDFFFFFFFRLEWRTDGENAIYAFSLNGVWTPFCRSQNVEEEKKNPFRKRRRSGKIQFGCVNFFSFSRIGVVSLYCTYFIDIHIKIDEQYVIHTSIAQFS